jgi:hypothetical protein
MLPYKFWFIWPIGFRREELKKISQSETRIACAGNVFLTVWDEMSNLYRGPSIEASYQVSDYLTKLFQRR